MGSSERGVIPSFGDATAAARRLQKFGRTRATYDPAAFQDDAATVAAAWLALQDALKQQIEVERELAFDMESPLHVQLQHTSMQKAYENALKLLDREAT